jgi:phosphate/sulfate permease
MEKENWINKMLDSTGGLQQVAPDAALFSKIKSRIRQAEFVSPKTVWLAAASIVLLVAVNVVIFTKTMRHSSSATTSIVSSFDKSNQLY